MSKHNIFDEVRKPVSVNNVFGDFLVNKGLYDEIEITRENIYELADLVGGAVKLDVFCPECGENRVFLGKAIPYYYESGHDNDIFEGSLGDQIVLTQQYINSHSPARFVDSPEESWTWWSKSLEDVIRLMVFKFTCSMDCSHHLDYVVITEENKMIKIGQFPSVADLSFPELKEYRKVMSKEDERELKRAIGLYAAGIGVGSFVYLRRIFERIIMIASKKAIDEGKVSSGEFESAHINEKIKMLADSLPKSLVNSAMFYGIVSKGIHELSEEECLEYFPVMQGFIIMILRQWEKIRKDEEEEKKIMTSLNSIASKVK